MVEQLGAARNTVRRALQMLAEEQQIIRNIGRGYIVEEASNIDNLVVLVGPDNSAPTDILETRFINEPAAAALAALRASHSELNTIAELAKLTAGAQTLSEREQADANFHLAIFKATRNPMLISLCESINLFRERAGWVEGKRRILSTEQSRDFDDEHAAIVEALMNRNAEQARAAMKKHIESLRDHLIGDTFQL